MNEVKPIIDENKLLEILNELKVKNTRNYILFMMGLHTGLRIGDILKLKVKDVYKKDKIFIIEEKTNKKKEIAISKQLKKELSSFCKGNDPGDFLIKSRKGENSISRCQAYRIIKKIAAEYKINNIGCHSLRKTFGRKYYKKYGDLEELRKFFNHSNVDITRRYIGIEQEIIDSHVKDLWN